MELLAMLVSSILTCIVGYGIGKHSKIKKEVSGKLLIRRTEPDEPPYVFSEFYTDIENIAKSETIVLKIDSHL